MNINNSTAFAREGLQALLLLKLYHLHIKILLGMLPFKRGVFIELACVIQLPELQPRCFHLNMDSI
jgi:hypothetical protein